MRKLPVEAPRAAGRGARRNPMRFRAVLFDLDNTLIDFMTFKKETAKAAAKAMVAKGLKADELGLYGKIFEVYERHGIEYQKTFFQVVRQYGLEANEAEKVQQAAVVAYLRRKFEVLRPYPEVKPTLAKLRERGLSLGIVTDAPRNKAWQRLVITGLDSEFGFVISHDDTLEFKPHPSVFQAALRRLGTLPAGVLFVGDNPERDIRGAKEAGMATCFARYGYTGSKKVPDSPDFTIDGFGELLKVVG